MDTPKLLIVDLEATCWDKAERGSREMEVIEIGAVLVDSLTTTASGEFQSFVRPIICPQLSDYCRKLTAIEQKDVDMAPLFPMALAKLLEFAGDISKITLASWGNYDRNQLLQDCQRHKILYPFGEVHVNIKQIFANTKGIRECGMSKALRILGLQLEGTHHRALDDVRNICRIWQHITRNVE
jgi:inhibitor of KinA sporulation pathway (predicted exonuclease)